MPSLGVRLISPQQIMQQCVHTDTKDIILAQIMIFSWDGNNKTIPYHGDSNLPVLVTAPGATLAQAYISKHFTQWNKVYLFKDKKGVNWDSRLIHGNKKSLPPELKSTLPQ